MNKNEQQVYGCLFLIAAIALFLAIAIIAPILSQVFKLGKIPITIVILSLIFLSILFFALSEFFYRMNAIASVLVQNSKATECDLYYNLPKGLIRIKHTVVGDLIDNGEEFVDFILKGESFEILEPKIVADKNAVLGVKYLPSIFMSDSIPLAINPQGLLHGEALEYKLSDQTDEVFGKIAELSDNLENSDISLANNKARNNINEEKEFSKILIIDPSENGRKIEWAISGVNKSGEKKIRPRYIHFSTETIDFPDSLVVSNIKDKYNGLLSRPMQSYKLKIVHSETGEETIKYVYLPAPNRIIKTPIRRSLFVEKKYTLDFSNGLLQKNTINKPSEVLAFITIPFNILDALFSLPAKILSIQISNEKSLEKIKLELEKETTALKGEIVTALNKNLEASKAQAELIISSKLNKGLAENEEYINALVENTMQEKLKTLAGNIKIIESTNLDTEDQLYQAEKKRIVREKLNKDSQFIKDVIKAEKSAIKAKAREAAAAARTAQKNEINADFAILKSKEELRKAKAEASKAEQEAKKITTNTQDESKTEPPADG